MTPLSSLAELKKLVELAEKLPEGKWFVDWTRWHNSAVLVHVTEGEGLGRIVMSASMSLSPRLGVSAEQQANNNSEFAAASRNSIPALRSLLAHQAKLEDVVRCAREYFGSTVLTDEWVHARFALQKSFDALSTPEGH